MTSYRFIEQAPIEGRVRLLSPGTTIGRGPCDIELPDPEVSRRHAILRQVDFAAGIEDLGSTNGTFVNGRRIEGIAELVAGDSLRFGNTVWHFEGAAEDDAEDPRRASTRTTAARTRD